MYWFYLAVIGLGMPCTTFKINLVHCKLFSVFYSRQTGTIRSLGNEGMKDIVVTLYCVDW